MYLCVILCLARRCFYFGGIGMAKVTMNVDNGLDEIKLENRDKMENKKKKEKTKKNKEKKSENKKGFFKQVRAEMKLVTWASSKSVFKYSVATILMIVLMALFFIGLSALFDLLYALVQGWIG